jgi:cell division protein FtsL
MAQSAAAVDYRAIYAGVPAEAAGTGAVSAGDSSAARTRAKDRREPAYKVSLFAAAGSAVAGFLILLMVLSNVRVNALSRETVELNSRLESLVAQERRLKIEYERAFDMAQVERYARDVLGMQSAGSVSTGTIDATPPDKAVVLGGEESAGGVFAELASFISSLFDYFK